MSDLHIVLTTAVRAIFLPSLTVHGDSSALFMFHALLWQVTPPLLHNSTTATATRNKPVSKCRFANINIFHTSKESETEQTITVTLYLCKYICD